MLNGKRPKSLGDTPLAVIEQRISVIGIHTHTATPIHLIEITTRRRG
jgi:hypothetical protein